MKVAAVILAVLGFVLALTGVSLLRDYTAYKTRTQAEVIQLNGREPVFQIPETDGLNRKLTLQYGSISGTGVNRVPDNQPMYEIGQKVDLIYQVGKPSTARLPDSFSYTGSIVCLLLGMVLAAGGAALFIVSWRRPTTAAKVGAPTAKKKPAQRLGI
jgi:hypothetical protein